MQSKSQVLLLPGETERYKCAPRASLKSPSTGFFVFSHTMFLACPCSCPSLTPQVSWWPLTCTGNSTSAVPLGNREGWCLTWVLQMLCILLGFPPLGDDITTCDTEKAWQEKPPLCYQQLKGQGVVLYQLVWDAKTRSWIDCFQKCN